MRFLRVNELPPTPLPQTVYYVLTGTDVEEYIVGFDGIARQVIAPSSGIDWADVAGKPTFATVATSGAYGDLSGRPTLGTAASAATTDFATASQGLLAASASQPGHTHTIANVSGLQTALDAKQPLATVLTNTTAAFTTAQETKLAGIETGADVTDATNVNAAGAVMNSDYSPSHSILVQQSGTGSPTALQVANNTLLGRLSGGGSEIDALTASEVRSFLNVADGAQVNNVYVQATDPGLTGPGLWIQTGLAPGGTGFTFWFEDGL
jgi:hypothetical protein